MRLLFSIALCCAAVLGTTFFSLHLLGSDPSTGILDADIQFVEQRLVETTEQMSAYSGGAILGIYQAQHAILTTTRDMLQLKRSSLLRRINLTYTVDGTTYVPNPERLDSLASDIQKVIAERNAAQAEADRYSGGLLKTVALMQVATADLTMSQLKMTELAETYGFLLQIPETTGNPQPIGQDIVSEEGDAL